jgi:hypothetical protein
MTDDELVNSVTITSRMNEELQLRVAMLEDQVRGLMQRVDGLIQGAETTQLLLGLLQPQLLDALVETPGDIKRQH